MEIKILQSYKTVLRFSKKDGKTKISNRYPYKYNKIDEKREIGNGNFLNLTKFRSKFLFTLLLIDVSEIKSYHLFQKILFEHVFRLQRKLLINVFLLIICNR
jgi:hypothetical protein